MPFDPGFTELPRPMQLASVNHVTSRTSSRGASPTGSQNLFPSLPCPQAYRGGNTEGTWIGHISHTRKCDSPAAEEPTSPKHVRNPRPNISNGFELTYCFQGEQCRRRKIRCSGGQPCVYCQDRAPRDCLYRVKNRDRPRKVTAEHRQSSPAQENASSSSRRETQNTDRPVS